MPTYIQIGDDPTQWWLAEPFQASQLTGQPLSLQVSAPVVGTLVLSGNPSSVAVFDLASGQVPAGLGVSVPAVYVPTTAGISAGHVGYQLPAPADLGNLASRIAASMSAGNSQTIALGGASSGGTLVLNGATLSFVVLCQVTVTGPITTSPMPHD